jgi:hypothetical protein
MSTLTLDMYTLSFLLPTVVDSWARLCSYHRVALRYSVMTKVRLLTVQPEPDRADVISPIGQSLGANGFYGVLWRICTVMDVGNE